MFLWFLGTAIASVWFVFRDVRFDYRFLCIGVLLPDLADLPMGGARAFHSVTISVGALVGVVVASTGRKRWRKPALGVPIGMMLHLVFDGAFSDKRLFWWPLGGTKFEDLALPSVERGLLNIPLEVAGGLILLWVIRYFGLGSASRRRRFATTGQLEPVGPPATGRR